MNWALKGLDGPLKNQTFPIKPGLTLGRQGDVVVPDTKSSAIHARITQSPKGAWVLEDNSSKNGTRINGERITSATLQAGATFYIGDQGFEVIEIQEVMEEETRPPLSADIIAAAEAQGLPAPPPEKLRPVGPPPKTRRYWHEILAEFVANNQEHFSERKKPVSPLNPAVVLEFVRGIQVNSKWILGYGPRKVGPSALDLPIWEPGAPAVCFEILPSSDGIVFKTAHPGQVTLNGQALDTHVLHVGDKIQINETIIEVDFEQ